MVQKVENEKIRPVMWPQWVAGFGVTLLLLQLGMMAGWSSPYIAYLTSPESHISITMYEASWVVSLLNLGRLVGAIAGSLAVNYLGSKTTILVTCLPIGLCWIFTIVANQVEWLYAARSMGGITLGMAYSSFQLYLGEIADPAIRGALVVLAITGLTIGNLTMALLGAYLTMDISGIVCLILGIILMLIFVWLPESPHYLVKKKLDDKARASILWYHRDCDVETELESLQKFIEANNSLPFVDVLREFKLPHIRKALILVTFLLMYSMMCGLNNVLFYMESILRNAHVTIIDPAEIVIIVTASGIGSSLFSMFLVDRCGRRILMILSCTFCAISLACLSAGFQLLDAGYDAASVQGLPIFGVIFFQVSCFIGVLSIPNTVLGEIFPPHVKCTAVCFSSVSAGVFSFISTATYQPLIDLFTEKYVYYIYGVLLLTAIPYVLIFMPETKGKSLQQIQEDLTKKS